MRGFTILATLSLLSQCASAQGSYHTWTPQGPNDFRGSCPMMNTLANHGFLPHDGKNLTLDKVTHALGSALNFDPALASVMFKQALPANPAPNATFFTLDQLNRHNVLEHDASMSRSDAFFGNNHVFNETIFSQTRQFWTSPVLDRNMLANGKLSRQIQSRATNPIYTFTNTTEAFSIGELLAPVIAFGNRENATVRRDLVDYFFKNERLPTCLGWRRQAKVVTLQDILRLSGIFSDACSLLTADV